MNSRMTADSAIFADSGEGSSGATGGPPNEMAGIYGTAVSKGRLALEGVGR